MPQNRKSLGGKKCAADQDYNPYTKRCNKKCKVARERFRDTVKKTFKCYKKCKSGSVRRAETKRCTKKDRPNKMKEIENVLADLDAENERDEEDVQELVHQFSELMKIYGKNLRTGERSKIKKIMNGHSYDDDVNNELDAIFARNSK